MSLSNIRIVLIQTSHPGNIGAAARAMKTMGLSDLCLVNPARFPDAQAQAMASGADDILQQADVVESLADAVADCQVVIGTSARSQRTLRWVISEPRECGVLACQQVEKGKVALVFGRERTGLTNEELALCHQLVHIPSNPELIYAHLEAYYQCVDRLLFYLDLPLGWKNCMANSFPSLRLQMPSCWRCTSRRTHPHRGTPGLRPHRSVPGRSSHERVEPSQNPRLQQGPQWQDSCTAAVWRTQESL